MSDYQNIVFTGNLGKEPEMRFTPSGQAVTSFSVASNRQYTNNGGEQVKETTWYRVSAWGKLAEICHQYLHKGSKVLIEGRLTPDKSTGGPRVWTTTDGKPASSFEVNAQIVNFLSPKSDGGMVETAQALAGEEDQDVPF